MPREAMKSLVLGPFLIAATACGPGAVANDGSESGTSSESSSNESTETGGSPSTSETDTQAETETETGIEVDMAPETPSVLEGEIPDAACSITPGPSDDAVCQGGPCPLTTDVLVHCDDAGFLGSSTSLAPGNDGPWLRVGSSHEWLFRLSGSSGEVLPYPQNTPFGFPRFAQDSTGELAVVGIVEDFWADASWPQGVHRLTPLDASQWAHEHGPGGDYSRFMDGVEVDPEERLHVWTGPQPEVWITRDASGVWTEQDDTVSNVGSPRTLAVDGETAVGFRFVASQFYAEIGGEKYPLGTPQGSQSELIRVARVPKPSWGGIGPEYAATTTHDTGTQIHWLGGELLLPEAALMPEVACPPDHPDGGCEPSCTFDEVGVFQEDQASRGAVGVARTADGVLWLAWVETHLVLEYSYTQVCDQDRFCVCETEVITDDRSYRLRLLRYEFEGEPVEVLTMPFAGVHDGLPPKLLADAFADRLVIALFGEVGQDETGYRVLELDTDAL